MNPAEVKQQFKPAGEIPYESERKFSAVFYEKEGARHVAAKGAVETILDFCTRMVQDGGQGDLNREGIERQAEEMAEKGLRVPGVAGGEAAVAEAREGDFASPLSGLVFHGLVGFIDPLRPEAAESIKKCKEEASRSS